MRGSLRKMGNSTGVILPEPLLKEIGSQRGDVVDIQIEAGRIVISPLPASPRAGWAEDARKIAETETALAWPEFPNLDDAHLRW